MQISHRQRLGLLWLLLCALLTVFLFFASQIILERAIRERLRDHLMLTLDESNFGNAQNRVNAQETLMGIGHQINATLQNLVSNPWYSAQKNCVVRVQRIDEIAIGGESLRRNITVTLLRNQIEREVVVGLSCSPNWWIAVGIGGLLGAFFMAIGFVFPPPLSKTHRQWINYLLEHGYTGAEAFAVISHYDSTRLTMRPAQLACLEQLHNTEQRNFSWVLEMVTDIRVAALDGDHIDWFALGLRSDPGSLEGALGLASADDSVVIDLNEMTLSVRGLDVPISRTPLFYYAWYAMSRLKGEGWITNPASNRPDRDIGLELVNLMTRFDGHAKAINDLEQTGLKARTLDQNRNKIKDDIVAALGEKLAKDYLFEVSKHPDGIRMRYRLQLDASLIRIIP